MKKGLTVVFLLLIIIVSFSFVIIEILARGADNSYFNTHWRPRLASQPRWRQILDLHYDGDGREDYLGNRYSKISVTVQKMSGEKIDDEILKQTLAQIQQVTKKPTTLIFSGRDLPYYESVEKKQLNDLIKTYRQPQDDNAAASVYLFLVSRKRDEPKLLGSTYREYGIIVYMDALKDFTKDSPQTFNSYILGTILHEFGHQIGLSHNNLPGCLMNEHAEVDHIAKTNPAEVVIDFCEQEIIN